MEKKNSPKKKKKDRTPNHVKGCAALYIPIINKEVKYEFFVFLFVLIFSSFFFSLTAVKVSVLYLEVFFFFLL